MVTQRNWVNADVYSSASPERSSGGKGYEESRVASGMRSGSRKRATHFK